MFAQLHFEECLSVLIVAGHSQEISAKQVVSVQSPPGEINLTCSGVAVSYEETCCTAVVSEGSSLTVTTNHGDVSTQQVIYLAGNSKSSTAALLTILSKCN